MDVMAWQKRLSDTFSTNGILGARVQMMLDAEAEHGAIYATKFKGQMALGESFKDFCLETFELLNRVVAMHPEVVVTHHYLDLVGRHTMNFRSVGAAEMLCHYGYPLQGYSLLRNLFEQAVLLSAIMQGMTTMEAVEGVSNGFVPVTLKRDRIREEKRIFNLMHGAGSGLSEETIQEIAIWDDLFDLEVHGSRLSKIDTKDWLEQKSALHFVPQFNQKALAMYMDRANEIGWMVLRVLPSLQPGPLSFGDEWANKWRVLDESFKIAVDSLGKECGKRISAAIIEFVEDKFPFGPDYRFPI